MVCVSVSVCVHVFNAIRIHGHCTILSAFLLLQREHPLVCKLTWKALIISILSLVPNAQVPLYHNYTSFFTLKASTSCFCMSGNKEEGDSRH